MMGEGRDLLTTSDLLNTMVMLHLGQILESVGAVMVSPMNHLGSTNKRGPVWMRELPGPRKVVCPWRCRTL